MLAFPILYPYGNLTAIDTLFFGCSGSTESGLNTFDVKDLKTYQQVYIYIIPIITNLMFNNAVVVIVRIYWFRQRLREAGVLCSLYSSQPPRGPPPERDFRNSGVFWSRLT